MSTNDTSELLGIVVHKPPLTRWPPRAATVLAGLVLWIVTVLAPLILLGELKRQFVSPGVLFAFLWLAPVVLVVSTLWRSQLGQLVIFPLTVVMAVVSEASLTGPRIYGWVPFWLVSIAAVAYFVVLLTGDRPSPVHAQRKFVFHDFGFHWLWHTMLHGGVSVALLVGPWWFALGSQDASGAFVDLDGQRDQWRQSLFVSGWLLVWIVVTVRYQLPLLFGSRTTPLLRRKKTIWAELTQFREIEMQKDRIKLSLFWAALLAALCIASLIFYWGNR